MIAAIIGHSLSKTPGNVCVRTAGGVVYKVLIPVSYYSKVVLGQEIFLHTVYRIREDQAFLYGFFSDRELEIFKKLISVSGIGGKTALAVLSAYSIDEIGQIFLTRDDLRISAIPGIGKKIAQRMILELAGDLKTQDPELEGVNKSFAKEILSALVNLGFNEKKSQEAVKKVLIVAGDQGQFEEVFKKALKEVSKS